MSNRFAGDRLTDLLLAPLRRKHLNERAGEPAQVIVPLQQNVSRRRLEESVAADGAETYTAYQWFRERVRAVARGL